MSPRIASTVCLLATIAAPTPIVGFVPPSSISASARTTSSSLQMSSHASEEFYPQLLNKASLCAHSDTCSIESAELYLKEIVHVQSGCAAGTMSGNAICNDVLGVTEVVADLRQKIGEGAKREVRNFWDMRQEELENLALAADTGSVGAITAPIKPAYLAIAALYALLLVSLSASTMDANGVVPFTAQEVWWSIRDGYAGDLASHFFHNGGLAVGEPVAATVGNALSPQELFWSIRDGYAADTLFSDGMEGGVESVPFTSQEIWWAVQHGYTYDMLSHWFRNGGLSV
eukprot:CAMPEP_0183708762 /NCGR_PEP_ID=MMETSP0737-20130205/4970_1 /TAXON_ID=385413 /ORGANISM="Thalassiosira miniscula, Strain CCMP1093" /LENGTH=286 /DNA_ID=CAMNT_0025936695 /DNA_START=120 /DNA_END=980 /DNA_ORIENTATION=+